MFLKQASLIILLICLISLGTVAAQGGTSILYVIQSGDTLFSIARRYGVAVDDIVQYNGLLNPRLVNVGQNIKIPVTQQTIVPLRPNSSSTIVTPLAHRIHVVQVGENLFRVALKYRVSVDSISSVNNLKNTALIFVGQELTIPIPADANDTDSATPTIATLVDSDNAGLATSTIATPADPFLTFDIDPLSVAQGGIVVVKIRTRESFTFQGSFNNGAIPFSQEGDTFFGIVGVSADPMNGLMPGTYPLSVTASDASGTRMKITTSVQVDGGYYKSESISLPQDRRKLLDPVLLQEERNKLNAVWTVFNPGRRWNGPFSVPIGNLAEISSPFGTRRSYDGGLYSSYHEGTDFSARRGTAIFAPADGVVALAESLTVRGNAVLIDHGWGVYSGMYHLSSIDVSVGQ